MRYLVLSDIHANLAALEAVVKHAAPFDQIWCLGDIVGYGPDPNECVGLLRRYDHLCVAGNHDWAALGRLDVDEFNPDARRASLWTQAQLTAESQQYLQTLPQRMEHANFELVHGSPREPIWEYVLYSAVAALSFPWLNTAYCFVGHTHTPAVFQEIDSGDTTFVQPLIVTYDHPFQLTENRLIINPGSLGQPRDGDARSSYIELDIEQMTITYRRVAYAVEVTQARMRACELPARLISRLTYGW
jgi:predicted phosphodiesterase